MECCMHKNGVKCIDFNIFGSKNFEGKRPLRILRFKLEDNIKMDRRNRM
jgi:hypothetical protein